MQPAAFPHSIQKSAEIPKSTDEKVSKRPSLTIQIPREPRISAELVKAIQSMTIKDSPQIRPSLEIIKSEQTQSDTEMLTNALAMSKTLKNQLEKDKNNTSLLYGLARTSIVMAQHYQKKFLKSKNSNLQAIAYDYSAEATKFSERINHLSPLNANYYYTKALIYDFRHSFFDSGELEACLESLQLSSLIDPAHLSASFLKNKIETLKAEWNESPAFLSFLRRFSETQQPLNELFRKNPALFQLANRIDYKSFFERYPHLRSIPSFIKQFPNLGMLSFYGNIKPDYLRGELAKATVNPFVSYIFMKFPTPKLTLALAHEIKEAMLNFMINRKTLHLILGNQRDAEQILFCFKSDQTLTPGALTDQFIEEDSSYLLSISPDNPYKRIAKPILTS